MEKEDEIILFLLINGRFPRFSVYQRKKYFSPFVRVQQKKKFHGWLDSMPILGVPGIFIESSHYAKHAMPKEDAEY